MYESPIELLITDIQHQIVKQQDDEIYKAVVHFIPNIDKEELLRALQYDRGQYERGYADGKRDAMDEFVWISVNDRLPEVGQLCLCYKERKGRTGYQMGTFLGAVFSENCAAFKSISHYGCVGATHWMPLPDPPKGE